MKKTENIVLFKGGELHDGQKRIVQSILKGNEKYNIISASRQSGKSFLLKQLVLYFSINYSKTDTLIVSPFNSQNLKIYDEIYNAIVNSNIIKKGNRTEKCIEFINGSKLYFKSAENPDAIRGGSYDHIFADEFAFYKADIWDVVINPTMAAKKNSRAFIFSTPRGKNQFFDMAMLGQNPNEKNYAYYYMSYVENPRMDLAFVEECRKKYPKAKFQQEFEGAFLDHATVFDGFENLQLISEWIEPEKDVLYFGGLDLANKQDKTVLTIMDEDGNVVFIYSNNKTKWKTIVEDVISILKKYNNAHCLIEVNNVGDVVYEMIEDNYFNIEPIVTANANKGDYIEELIASISNAEIILPTNELFPDLSSEMNTFELTFSPKTRKTVYAARTGFHDDTVISLALSNKNRKENNYKAENKGGYGVYIL